MKTIGLDMNPWIKSGILKIHASRPSIQGLELHLSMLHKLLIEFNPRTIIIDPISSLMTIGTSSEVRAMLVRLMDTLKKQEINAMFTSLTHRFYTEINDATVDAASSLADTWIDVTNDAANSNRIRKLLIVKTRGMGHFNNQTDFVIT